MWSTGVSQECKKIIEVLNREFGIIVSNLPTGHCREEGDNFKEAVLKFLQARFHIILNEINEIEMENNSWKDE